VGCVGSADGSSVGTKAFSRVLAIAIFLVPGRESHAVAGVVADEADFGAGTGGQAKTVLNGALLVD
jgi:hypothetical protein